MGLFSQKQPPKEINRVKLLGLRKMDNSGALATYNSTLYSLLIEYTDGSRELKELVGKDMQKYLMYINMD